ncbi:MAG: hypothetical protein ACRBCT_00250 [Alphaproteobacteria bacterium]
MGKIKSHNTIDILLTYAKGDMVLVERSIKTALKKSKDGRIDINDVIAIIAESRQVA